MFHIIVNYLLVALILGGVGYAVYWYFAKAASIADDDIDIETSAVVDENFILQIVKEAFTAIINQDINRKSLTREEQAQKRKKKARLKLDLKTCTHGDHKAKLHVKSYIKDIITTNPKCNINEDTINDVIHFEHPERMSSKDKFLIMLVMYMKKYSARGFSKIVKDYDLIRKVNIDGESYYKITPEMIHDIYPDFLKKFPISYSDKLDILTQRLYEKYKGLAATDLLFENTIDEIDVGTSGIPEGTFEKSGFSIKNIPSSYEAIWIVFGGLDIQLSCTWFDSQSELIRVCKNIYKYNPTSVLNRKTGKVVATMKNGNRVTVAQPPFCSTYAFWARKFDTAPARDIKSLIPDKGNIIPILIMKNIIHGQRNVCVTGMMGTGKTTLLKALITFIDTTFNIRVQELAAELNLNFAYPFRNITGFQETDYTSEQEGLNFMKKTNGAVCILGEIADAIQAILLAQLAKVASLFTMFTHHAKTTEDLVLAIANNFLDPKDGIYKDKEDAITAAAEILHIDCHLAKTKTGHRYIERITEVVPASKKKYPFEEEDFDVDRNTLHYYKQSTDKDLFNCIDIVRYVDDHYELVNEPSKQMQEAMKARMTDEEVAEFEQDLLMLQEETKKQREAYQRREAV